MTPLPNPLGVHALVWAGDTSPESVHHAVHASRDAGYDLLELSLHDAANLDVQATRRELDDAGLGVVCSRGLPFDADIGSENPTIVERGARLLHESLQLTRALGGTHFTGALYGALGKHSAPVPPSGRANVISVLRDLAHEAATLDVTLGLEICNRYETNVVNTAAYGLRLAEDIGADNVMIHLDTYHMNIEENDFVEPVLLVGDRLGYVHVGENHRGYLGAGHIDFDEFFGALAEIGYTGPVTFESFSSAVVSPTLSIDLAIWRNMWSDGVDLAAAAHDYLSDRISSAWQARAAISR